MKLSENYIEIECPACRQSFYSKETNQVECLSCKSIIELDKNKKVIGYEPPEYHGTALIILAIISLILLTPILIDALLSEDTLGKLIPVGIMVIMLPLLYFWFPIRYRWLGRKYGRFGLMIGFTLMLLLLLIFNFGNFFSH